MLAIFLPLRFVLCLMALAPITILAAPVAHQRVAPPPAADQDSTKATGDTLAATTATVSVPITMPTPNATATAGDIPSLIIPVTDESGDDAHVLPVEGRSAELAAAIRSQNGDVPPLLIPVTDESGDNAHIIPVVEGRAETMTSAEDVIPPPLIITTEDDSLDCADNRGGCDITTA